MQKKSEELTTHVETIIEAIQEKKGKKITLIDLTRIKNSVASYFIICTGNTDRQTQAIADSVEDECKKQLGERPYHIEGAQRGEWVLVDYVDIVVHIFLPDTRQFYRLEELWGDGDIKHFQDID